jgi:hypothetical protein
VQQHGEEGDESTGLEIMEEEPRVEKEDFRSGTLYKLLQRKTL